MTQALTSAFGAAAASADGAKLFDQTDLVEDLATALRNKDKLNQALYGAKIIIDMQIKDGLSASLEGMQTAIGGLSATVGVVAGLNALQSNDTRTQISGAVGLFSSANQLAVYYKAGNGTQAADGFLDKGQLGVLNTLGALISIANLRNLDNMLENGQVGSAVASVYAAWQAGSALYAASTGAGSFLTSMGSASAFNPGAFSSINKCLPGSNTALSGAPRRFMNLSLTHSPPSARTRFTRYFSTTDSRNADLPKNFIRLFNIPPVV